MSNILFDMKAHLEAVSEIIDETIKREENKLLMLLKQNDEMIEAFKRLKQNEEDLKKENI